MAIQQLSFLFLPADDVAELNAHSCCLMSPGQQLCNWRRSWRSLDLSCSFHSAVVMMDACRFEAWSLHLVERFGCFCQLLLVVFCRLLQVLEEWSSQLDQHKQGSEMSHHLSFGYHRVLTTGHERAASAGRWPSSDFEFFTFCFCEIEWHNCRQSGHSEQTRLASRQYLKVLTPPVEAFQSGWAEETDDQGRTSAPHPGHACWQYCWLLLAPKSCSQELTEAWSGLIRALANYCFDGLWYWLYFPLWNFSGYWQEEW